MRFIGAIIKFFLKVALIGLLLFGAIFSRLLHPRRWRLRRRRRSF